MLINMELIKKFENIKYSKSWIHINHLDKGWSSDRKYLILDQDNNKYLLRISNISLLEKKKKQFEYLKKVNKLDINASKVIDFGILNDQEIYMLFTYIEGNSAEEIIQMLSNEEAYQLGVNAGKMLQKIHSIPIEVSDESWQNQFQEKMRRKIEIANKCELDIPNKDLAINYIQNQSYLLNDCTQSFCHGDYHLGNMIINNNEISIIDFDKCRISDSYYDLNPFCWNVFKSEYFATGLVNGFFNNQVPMKFWQVLSLYAAEIVISQLPWSIAFGEEEIEIAYKVINSTLKWFDNFKLTIPTWYKNNLY